MDKELGEMETQEKIAKIVQKRHEQLSEIKLNFDWNNQQSYKGIAHFGKNLEKLEKLFPKKEYHLKCENIISLTLSIGKVMDLNNSIKTILLSIKIFEEHKNSINSKNNSDSHKNFISNLFNKNKLIPLSHNDFIKERIKQNLENNDSYKVMSKFYESSENLDECKKVSFLNRYYVFKKIKK